MAAITASDPMIGRAYEAMNQFNWSEEELLAYEREIKRVMDNIAVEDYIKDHAMEEGRKKGREEGREEGKKEGAYDKALHIARHMLFRLRLEPQTVSQATGLSLEELQKLKEK